MLCVCNINIIILWNGFCVCLKLSKSLLFFMCSTMKKLINYINKQEKNGWIYLGVTIKGLCTFIFFNVKIILIQFNDNLIK